MTTFPDILTNVDVSEQNAAFRKSLFGLKPRDVNAKSFKHLVSIYHRSKQKDIRYHCLLLLYNKKYESLKTFFEEVYNRSRRTEYKMMALRGLTQFLSKEEICPLVEKFIGQVNKSMVSTPYDYTSLQYLKGWNALPYLRLKYGYSCFRRFHKVVNRHYRKLPWAFKYHFWIDWKGQTREYPWSAQSHDRIERFLKAKRSPR